MKTHGGCTGDRGLVFTLDMIAALLFFLVIILSVLWLWGEIHRHINEYRESEARQDKLLGLSSLLVKTEGNPPYWYDLGSVNAGTLHAIGLAREDNVLDGRKLDKMADADYQELRKIMGLGSEDFRLTVTENWSGDARVVHTIGNEVASSEVRVVRRYALLNNTRVEVKLKAYYNKK